MSTVLFPSGIELAVVEGPDGRKEQHWDPKSTGNPLLDSSDRDAALSTHFTVDEFAETGSTKFDVARIDPRFIEALELLRAFVGKRVRITSGYRSWEYNEKLYERRGKRPTRSRHCCGQAADIRIDGMDGIEIGKAAIDACGVKIAVGIDRRSAHIDIRGRGTQWTYFDGEENRRVKKEIKAYRKMRKRNPLPPPEVPEVESPGLGIVVPLAVARNHFHAEDLGWESRRADVELLLGIEEEDPTAVVFAQAVAAWQEEHNLLIDGILGPVTWRRLQLELPGERDGGGPF